MATFSEYTKNRKKKKEEEYTKGQSFADYTATALADNDIAPVKEELTEKEKKAGGWFDSGAFSDGYQLGDISKTILGTLTDINENVTEAVLDATENLIDTTAYGVGAIGGLFSDDFKDDVGEFIAKDLLHAKEVSEAVVKYGTVEGLLNLAANDGDTESASVLGDKSDGTVQSAAHLVGQAALQYVGVPWYVTAGVNSFGSEIESALNEDATYTEAGVSGAITTGAELLTEKLFGAFKFQGKAADDLIFDKFTKNVSSKVVKSLMKFGWDATGEGAEEVLSGAISAVGQKLTYADEKEWGELYTSEEAWDSFIGGAVLGGGGSAIYTTKNVTAGRDAVTGLTENEQTVLDKEVERLVAEAEKDGTMLTNKQKNEIYEKVQEDLKKGYISTDTIESVLGGDTYKSYKDTIDNEDAILKEYEELGKKKNATLAEQSRYAELKEKVKEIESNSKRSQLKSQLSEEVYNSLSRQDGKRIQTDDFLIESYNEKARSGQAFNTDLSKYKGKEKDTLQKIMEKGQVNNTRRAHEFWEYAAKVSADRGIGITSTTTEEILKMETEKHGAEYVEKNFKGKIPNGYIMENGDIAINVNSPNARRFILGHEIGHQMENTADYGTLKDLLYAYAESKEGKDTFKKRKANTKQIYGGIKGANADVELTNDLIGEYLYDDADFVYHLSSKNPNLFRKIWNEVKYLYKMATAGSQEQRDLLRIQKTFEKAYRESVKTESETKGDAEYSLSGITEDGIEVYETSQDIMNLTWDERKAKYLDVMKNEYRGRTAKFERNGHTYYAEFDQNSIRKHIYGDKRSSPNGAKALIKAGADGDVFTLVENSEYRRSRPNTKDHTDADYFDYFVKTVQIDGKVFDLVADVEKKYGDDGGYVYTLALTDNKKIKASTTHGTSPVKNVVNASDDIISQNSKKSSGNSKFSLSAEQQEYFKDSVVRDENGDLKVMYHGTSKGGHTVFDTFGSNYGLFGQGSYFTDDKSVAESYTKKGKGNNPQVYESYLNITNPMDMDAEADIKAWTKAVPDADFSSCVTNEDCYRAMEEYLMDEEYSKWEAAEFATDSIMGMGYDGITHIGGGRFNKADETRHQVYIAFNPEQIKNIDNVKPTDNPDIRYSLSNETDKTYLDAIERGDTDTVQRMVDEAASEAGYKKLFYHGTASGDFTKFASHGKPMWITEHKDYAEVYAETKRGTGYAEDRKVMPLYAKMDNILDLSQIDTMNRIFQFNAPSESLENLADIVGVNTSELVKICKGTRFEELWELVNTKQFADIARKKGYDAIKENEFGNITYGVLDNTQLKSADAVTYKKNKVIPLSERFNTENEDIRYSLTQDSEGTKLTEEQSDFFKDTKALDRNGNLLKVYHTTNNDFTVFDKSKKGEATGDSNTYLGFFFADDSEYMQNFPEFENGKTEAYYLNMTNPIDMTNISKEAFLDVVEVLGGDVNEAAEIYAQELADERDRATLRGDNNTSLSLIRLLDEMTGDADYRTFIEELKPHYDELMSKGYDGVVNYLDELFGAKEYIVLDSNQAKLATNLKPTADDDVRYSFSSIANSFFGDENMTSDAFVEADYKQTQRYKDYVNQCLNNYRQTRADFDEDVAKKETEAAIEGIVKVAVAAKRAGYDIYDDPTKRSTKDSKKRLLFSSLEPNSDYFTSNDISTICDKRQNFAEIYDDIVRAEEAKGVPQGKRFFDNVDNYFYLHNLMAEKGLTQPCRQCYVESMRKNLAPMASAFLRLVRETNPNNTANDQLYQQTGKNKGNPKTNNAATREWVLEKLAEYDMTADDLTIETLTTEDGLAQLKIQAPLIYEAFNSFYGQSKPKMPKAATPFRFGELTALLTDEKGRIKRSLVDKINSTGGFRLQSYSDFQIQNFTDTLQVIFEAGTLGLNGHAYTKVPAFLDATEGTNLKRNISIFMYKDGNEWKLDRNDSFPYTLEKIYDIVDADKSGNTSIIAVSQNEDMSAWIMANDYVGYGIPFHKSGMKMDTVRQTTVKEDGREIKGYLGTKDHTKQQTEVWAKTTADHKALTKVSKGINIYRFWDFDNKSNLSKSELIEKNVKAYIDACEEMGYLPKFREYVINNGKVLNNVLNYSKEFGFVSPDATIEDISFEYKNYRIPYGYYKFLGDFGMFTPDGKASPHDVLSLNNYDFDKAVDFFSDAETLRRNEILQQFANGEERQKYRDSDLTAEELAEIVKRKRGEIAESVVAKHDTKKSLSLEGDAPISFNDDVPMSDLLIKPTQEDIAPVKEDVAKNATTTQGTVSNMEQVEDFAPISEEEANAMQRENLASLSDADVPPEMDAPIATESDIAPTREYEAIKPRPEKLEGEEAQWAKNKMARADKAPTEEQHTAEILDKEPETAKKKSRGWSKFKANFIDKGAVFEDLSLKKKNRKLMAKWNHTLSSESRAQWMIGKGRNGVKSLNAIREEVEKTGLTKQFYEYLYHKHNIDRMNLENRYEDVENKPVFGYDVTAEKSQEIVNQYEFAEPKFKEYAKDVYDYMNYLRKQLVDNGVISQETADLWAEMYPHYVPIRRVGDSGLNINVPLDTGRTGVNAPIKKATGGSRDILPLFDTMAMRTEQTFKAIARNSFGVELKNTLGSTIESNATSLDEMIDSIDKHEELLQKGENGRNPTFTVFENGEKVTFEITEDMYDALKPTGEGLKYTNKVANTVSNVHRGLLTEYNPVFTLTNAIKDVQDVFLNSKHATKTYANMPRAITELASKGKWYTEYMENGGERNTYFDGKANTFKAEDEGIKKAIGIPLRAISAVNNFVERAPRLAEYIASRDSGASVEEAMLDASRVTTNFAAGGDVTKFLNRNGATFLNASVQGAMQQVRNVREAKANGLKGWVQLATKFAVVGLGSELLNHLLWEDDEEYEELSDYVKQNYYVVAKYGDGQFVRIPKGRAIAVIQDAFEQVGNALTGDDEVDLKSFLELAISNLAPNNPAEDNILAPIIQVARNKTWYGEDLVPTRLQDLPASEQFDESTDSISKWLGEATNTSPIKWNYLFNQYSGGIGDVVLPMLTPEAESGDNSIIGNITAPLKDKFTTNSTMNNQNVSDFYDTMDELTTNAKASTATDEDVLKYKYFNSVNSELGELYGLKREIQNSDLPDDRKYDKVFAIQEQINALARESLNSYNNVYIEDGYASVGDRYYKQNDKGEWQKITDDQLDKQNDVMDELGISASDYWSNKTEYDFAAKYPDRYAVAKSVGGYDSYKTYMSDLYDIKADKDENGKSISGSRKEKVAEYINNLDADYGEKIILFKSEYKADDTYNYEIIEYLNSREDISYEEMVAILKELGFTVSSDGNVTWD